MSFTFIHYLTNTATNLKHNFFISLYNHKALNGISWHKNLNICGKSSLTWALDFY